RHGEMVFHDATKSYQHWLSCATCHPEGRADGLNWDMPNDGIGNPKSAKSLLQAHLTPPTMWRGIRDGMDSAAGAGFFFAAFKPAPEDLAAVRTYMRSLRPEQSPYRLANGELSEKAKRGKAVFENEKVGCTYCHTGEQFTGGRLYDVGTRGEFDPESHTQFDTPTLIELWRTAPYLHDGRAGTLADVFTKHNPKNQHGNTSQLSKEQIDDLVEYLLSL
ncbi:MAG TPA: c-type cytochrome, partial [Tepidisphaeraceae bacterium]|nr:c-type cytochrome [Tepidisphaeraceae bacterium]